MTGPRGILPERLEGPNGLVLRRWRPSDVSALSRAIAESTEHLRPWMAWIAEEPLSRKRRRQQIVQWGQEWAAGGDAVLGVFLEERIAGGCGLHHRLGPGGLEIGYWTHPAFVNRGVATAAAAVLTRAALALDGVAYVEIHHDKANRASRRIPEKLGYRLVGELPDQPEAPAECGIELRWRAERDRWTPPPEVPPAAVGSEVP